MITVRQLLDHIKENNVDLDSIIPNVTLESIYSVNSFRNHTPIFEIEGYNSSVCFKTTEETPIFKIETYDFTDFLLAINPTVCSSDQNGFESWKKQIRDKINFPSDMDAIELAWFKQTINHAFTTAIEYNSFDTIFKDTKIYE
jgi:hypothetical protein